MDLRSLSIEELIALMEDIKEVIKEKKNEINETNKNILLGIRPPKMIEIIFKGEPTIARFIGVTNARFTVEIDGVKKSILFDKLISTGT